MDSRADRDTKARFVLTLVHVKDRVGGPCYGAPEDWRKTKC